MARLTPLSKGLIGLAVIGAVASTVWHLGLKDWLSGTDAPAFLSGMTAKAPPAETTVSKNVAPVVVSSPAPPQEQPATSGVAKAATPPAASVPAPTADTVAPAASNATVQPVSGNHLSPAESGEMGRKFMDSGDFAQARTYLEQAVQGGDGAAACRLGEMTLKGQGGITADQDKAATLFQLAQAKNIICFASGK